MFQTIKKKEKEEMKKARNEISTIFFLEESFKLNKNRNTGRCKDKIEIIVQVF